MRAERSARRGLAVLALLVVLVTTGGCHLFRRGDGVSRTPAPVEPEPTPESIEAPIDEPIGELELPGDETAEPLTDEIVPEPLPESEQPPAEAVAPTPSEPEPAVDERPAQAEKPAAPEVEQVSIVEEDSPEPRLLPGDDEVSRESVISEIERAARLSGILAERALPPELGAQVDSGRAFLADAREALEADDLARAAVLAEKSLALLEDAEGNSRP